MTMYKQHQVIRLGEDWNTSVEDGSYKTVYTRYRDSFHLNVDSFSKARGLRSIFTSVMMVTFKEQSI